MTRHEFIFTKKFPERLYRHILFWIAYYCFELIAFIHPFLERTTFKKWLVVELVETFCHVTIQIFFCYMVIYFLWPKFLDKKKYFSFGLGILLLLILLNGIYYVEHISIFKSLHDYAGMPFWKGTPLILWFGFISTLSLTPKSTSVAIAIKLLKRFYNKLQENQQLTRENANAELQLLKAQIHPHFLFNTLNNIYAFTLNKSMQAPQLVMNLSDTLQYMITDCEADMVLLDQELKMINDYVDLEKVRYGNRLDFAIEIVGDTANKKIVPLLMIPFIENSFKHGASKMLRDAWIKLSIQADENVLHFTLTNNKPAQEIIAEKGGIGLSNVQKRLELLYPQQHLLTIESTTHTFTVNMQVPLEKIEEEVVT
ncbi:MAG: histidine kinase [Parafilimonas sp.]|nr:histidine kinase [Parafilimonas sp.]